MATEFADLPKVPTMVEKHDRDGQKVERDSAYQSQHIDEKGSRISIPDGGVIDFAQ